MIDVASAGVPSCWKGLRMLWCRSTPTLFARAGERALEAGEWSAARSSFEAALELEETPEALLGLGNALWWLDETEASLRYRERAYAAFRRRPDPFQAAATALQLAAHYGGSLGDVPAARGWGARAGRLVEEFELAPLEGWVLLGRAAGASAGGNPQVGEGFARQALEIARRVGDTDLELCALSQLGGALVLTGRVEEGALLLDEAMAGALGGEGGPETVVHASCVTIVCCSRAAELKRAAAVDPRRRRVQPPLRLAAPGRRVPHGLRRPCCWRPAGGPRRRRSSRARSRRCRRRQSHWCAPRRWRSSPSCAWRRDVSRRRRGCSTASRITPRPRTRPPRSTWPGESWCRPRRSCADAFAAWAKRPWSRRCCWSC